MLSIVGNPTKKKTWQGTWLVKGVFQWNSTDLTGQLPIISDCPRLITAPRIQVIGASARARVNAQVTPGTISATTTINLFAPVAGSVTRAVFVVGTTVATDASNIWTIGVVNKGAGAAGTNVVVDGTAAANSNNSTGGSAFTAQTPRDLTLSGTAANLVVARHDVLAFTFTKASAAANLVNPNILVEVANSGGSGTDEECFVDVASLIVTPSAAAASTILTPSVNASLSPPSLAVTVTRTSANPTSGAYYAFEYEGW